MRSSTASPSSPRFSYFLLFKEEFHEPIAAGLGPSPTVLSVFSFFVQNDRDYRTSLWIKPTRLDDFRIVTIESGNPPERPERQRTGWDHEDDEAIDEYEERLNRWQIERQRWFDLERIAHLAKLCSTSHISDVVAPLRGP
ncbi:855_t:CDS:2 [Acaulospora morrowiae]|uniref:855_t:CDS:1 n=1 Tax=Acaulospora morrowiae TaxID=94023 RepID=A0A9N9CPH3_9GLOM|nr:855_t:CDS:2 [Acaulospora morrowiae]